MEYQYKKDSDGYHFYKIGGEKILHVFHIDKDCTLVHKQSKHLTTEIEHKKDDCCINFINNLREDLIDSSKEEFENKIRQVIYLLDITDVCKNFNQ